jgi:hypothetical protein
LIEQVLAKLNNMWRVLCRKLGWPFRSLGMAESRGRANSRLVEMAEDSNCVWENLPAIHVKEEQEQEDDEDRVVLEIVELDGETDSVFDNWVPGWIVDVDQ